MVANSTEATQSTTSTMPPPPASEIPNQDTSSNPSPPPMNPRQRLRRPRGGIRRLLNSLVKIVDLQYRIWLTQAKLTLQRMMLYAALFAGAAVLGLLAIIFLYIGVFHLLTDVIGLRPVWAYLIYGGFHLVVAVALVMIGTSILGKKDDDEDEKKQEKKEEKKQAEAHDDAHGSH